MEQSALLPIEQIDYLSSIVDVKMLEILEEMVLLIPPQVIDEPWQTWFFAHQVPGAIRYPSFRHYLEHVFQDLQAQEVS